MCFSAVRCRAAETCGFVSPRINRIWELMISREPSPKHDSSIKKKKASRKSLFFYFPCMLAFPRGLSGGRWKPKGTPEIAVKNRLVALSKAVVKHDAISDNKTPASLAPAHGCDGSSSGWGRKGTDGQVSGKLAAKRADFPVSAPRNSAATPATDQNADFRHGATHKTGGPKCGPAGSRRQLQRIAS